MYPDINIAVTPEFFPLTEITYFGKSLFSMISNGNFNVFTLTKHKLHIPSQS